MRTEWFEKDLKYKFVTKNIFWFFILLTFIFPKPYVLVVSFDGFRYDYLDRVSTPNFDKLKMDGVSAESLISIFPSFTFPNHYSIATGAYAGTHGLIANSFYRKDFDESYSMRKKNTVIDGKWYGAEPIWVTAERQGINTATFFWVGSEAEINGYRPSIYESYDGSIPFIQRINTVFDWFSLPDENRPQLCMLYFNEPDHLGHVYGPESTQVDSSIIEMDHLLGLIMDKVNSSLIRDSLNLIIVSDHGMTTISKEKFIFLDKYVRGLYDLRVDGSGPVSHLFLRPTKSARKKSILRQLKRIPNMQTYLKEDIPHQFRISNENSGDFLLVADEGWSIFKSKRASIDFNPIGMHGYDPTLKSMQSIFMAYGPEIKSNIQINSFENIHIYPLLCKLLEIEPFTMSQGKLHVLEGIVK
ncbi:MAG: alkaline phosphatase family protein [Candidatus Marinimicrobia bacterium]|nr:alkaline phosphatase family protein [Candidatus Neomarinimicrobiota bacterium]